MERQKKIPRIWAPTLRGIQTGVSQLYEFLREKTTSFSALLGIDTTTVFLHGARLAPKAYIVKRGNGLWQAVRDRRGTSVTMQTSHGASGQEWEPASQETAEAVLQAVSQELAQYVVGGMSPKYVYDRLLTANITRLDNTQDIDNATLARANIVAPKSRYGEMRDKRYRNGRTHYWGRRGGYMKDVDGEYVLDEQGKRVYQRPPAKQIRAYDKRRQMLDSRGIDIGKDVLRIEIQLNGNRAIRQNLGFGTLGEYLACTDAELRIGTLFDELNVAVDGEKVDPLNPRQRENAEKNPRLAKRLKKNRKRRERREKEMLANTEKNQCQVTHCLYGGGGEREKFLLSKKLGLCAGAGGTPALKRDAEASG